MALPKTAGGEEMNYVIDIFAVFGVLTVSWWAFGKLLRWVRRRFDRLLEDRKIDRIEFSYGRDEE